MGAHVAGYTGKYYIERHQGKQLPRITGLDPAGPMFEYEETEAIRAIRLDRDDAEVVDVIHSNAGELDGAALYEIMNDCHVTQGMPKPTCIPDHS